MKINVKNLLFNFKYYKIDLNKISFVLKYKNNI